MSTKIILNEDWSEYDDKKKKEVDSRFFSCEEKWEREYLIGKIRKHYPEISRERVEAAIEACCKSVPAPRPRKDFVDCVMKRLGVDNNNGGGNPPPNPGPGPQNPPVTPGDRKVGKI